MDKIFCGLMTNSKKIIERYMVNLEFTTVINCQIGVLNSH